MLTPGTARGEMNADGLRIDHVAGLWRLWWVPPGESPDRGTYVHYDADVMLAVLEAVPLGRRAVGCKEARGVDRRQFVPGRNRDDQFAIKRPQWGRGYD